MSKVAVVFWSGTGNTEAMANLVKAGAEKAGAEVDLITAADFSADKIGDYTAIGFGCPSMGDEELEDGEFLPMWEACEAGLKGKKIGLFGSYGWGDGQWMRTWSEKCDEIGAEQVDDFVIAAGAPEGPAEEKLDDLGRMLARA